MNKIAAGLLLAIMTGLLAACGPVYGVNSADQTNLQGAPGTAGDIATGGQGNSFIGGHGAGRL